MAIRARKAKLVADHRRKKGAANAQAVLPRRAERERTANTATMKVGGVSMSGSVQRLVVWAARRAAGGHQIRGLIAEMIKQLRTLLSPASR